MKPDFNTKLASQLLTRHKLRLWMMKNLPMGLLSGMHIERLNEHECSVVLKSRWWIKNPFGSVFWAVMAMAAELSTGSLVYAWCSGQNIKFILTRVEGSFIKKVRGKSFYFCSSGQEVLRSLNELEKPGDNISISMPVVAHDQAGQKVAEFQFTWTIKIPEDSMTLLS